MAATCLNVAGLIFAQTTRALFAIVGVFALANACSAQHVFDFVEDGTGDVLATLELLKLPAESPSDIGSLTFSAAGDSVFGFGPTYHSNFEFRVGSDDPAFAPALNISGGELRSTTFLGTTLEDLDPGFTAINPDPSSSNFSMIFPPVEGTSLAYLNYQGRPSTSGGVTRRTFGTWQAVTKLGDCNLDGMVNFSDISPFIAVLSSGGFQAQADCDDSGYVDLSDISPFITILSGS